VQVTIRQAGGNEFESGPATRPGDEGNDYWNYQTTAAASDPVGLTVEAIAVNWPGKRASRMQLLDAKM
jgi:hypothetical protein